MSAQVGLWQLDSYLELIDSFINLFLLLVYFAEGNMGIGIVIVL